MPVRNAEIAAIFDEITPGDVLDTVSLGKVRKLLKRTMQ